MCSMRPENFLLLDQTEHGIGNGKHFPFIARGTRKQRDISCRALRDRIDRPFGKNFAVDSGWNASAPSFRESLFWRTSAKSAICALVMSPWGSASARSAVSRLNPEIGEQSMSDALAAFAVMTDMAGTRLGDGL